MEENATIEKKGLFNRMIKAGRRTYFVTVREAKNNNKYITITESKLVDKNKFDRFSIMVFQDKVDDFIQALHDASELVA